MPSIETTYGLLEYPDDYIAEKDIKIDRIHTQKQIALALIGHQLGFSTYIAANDQSIVYEKKPLLALPSVISDLAGQRLLQAWPEGVDAAKYIDCIWFKNCKLMPAVMEIEHSTRVISGLARLQKFKNSIPSGGDEQRWVIVAPDEDRADVLTKCSEDQFKGLKAKYMPYSAVDELLYLCRKRKIRGVTEEFLNCYMESAA